jgi:hypothetical protein
LPHSRNQFLAQRGRLGRADRDERPCAEQEHDSSEASKRLTVSAFSYDVHRWRKSMGGPPNLKSISRTNGTAGRGLLGHQKIISDSSGDISKALIQRSLERMNVSMPAVEALPTRIQMTFGGARYAKDGLRKSSSLERTVKPRTPAMQICGRQGAVTAGVRGGGAHLSRALIGVGTAQILPPRPIQAILVW